MSFTDEEILNCFPETLEEAWEQGLYVKKLYEKIKIDLNWKSGSSWVTDKTVQRRIKKLREDSFNVWEAHPTDADMMKKYGSNKRYYYRKKTFITQIYGYNQGETNI